MKLWWCRAVLFGGSLAVSAALMGCAGDYGHSRAALTGEVRYGGTPPPRGYFGYAYDPYFVAPGFSYGLSFRFGSPYYPYYSPFFAPYYPYYYPYPFAYYRRPYFYVPFDSPPRRRTFRGSSDGVSSAPSKPSRPQSSSPAPGSRRQFSVP